MYISAEHWQNNFSNKVIIIVIYIYLYLSIQEKVTFSIMFLFYKLNINKMVIYKDIWRQRNTKYSRIGPFRADI